MSRDHHDHDNSTDPTGHDHDRTTDRTSHDRTSHDHADFDLRERIDRLATLEGEGTELVTLTVPPADAIASVRERVAGEHAGAENIRSKHTRERVQRALARIQTLLDEYDETPESGLAIYAGVVDGDLVSAVFDDLPTPVAASTYRCDDRFDVAPLEAAVAPEETFGLVVVERGGAAVGRLVGERVVPVRVVESRVMRSSRAGGQSAARFARERERQVHEFYTEVAATANDAFLGDDPVAGLAVGGTLSSARAFVEGDYLDHRLRERLLGTYAVEYATEQGLRQLVDAAGADLLDAERRETRERLDDFVARLRDDRPVAYGDAVDRALEFRAVDTLLVSSALDRDRRAALATAAKRQGGETHVVDAETDRGARFTDAFGGVGALLRFPVD
jgi:peptide chain release factor subunit 1